MIIIGTIMSSQFPRATLWLCAVKDVDVDTMRCLNMKSSVALSIKSKDFNINAPRTVLYVLWVIRTFLPERQHSPVYVIA